MPRDRPLRVSSTSATFAYAHTSTSWPGLCVVQSMGSRCTIGSSVHWLRKRWYMSLGNPAVSTAPKNDAFTGNTSYGVGSPM